MSRQHNNRFISLFLQSHIIIFFKGILAKYDYFDYTGIISYVFFVSIAYRMVLLHNFDKKKKNGKYKPSV